MEYSHLYPKRSAPNNWLSLWWESVDEISFLFAKLRIIAIIIGNYSKDNCCSDNDSNLIEWKTSMCYIVALPTFYYEIEKKKIPSFLFKFVILVTKSIDNPLKEQTFRI